MKILFVRHGESVDDLTDQYGGWGDFPLTPKGKLQLAETAEKIAGLDIDFSIVLNSPLIRAEESASIIANRLKLPHQTYHYLKEKNGNGLLTGLNRAEAKKLYPELVKEHEDGYAYGSEPHDKFIERVKRAVQNIQKMDYENIIAVTHGGVMSQIFMEILGLKFDKAHDGGFVLLESISDLKLEIIQADGIDYADK